MIARLGEEDNNFWWESPYFEFGGKNKYDAFLTKDFLSTKI